MAVGLHSDAQVIRESPVDSDDEWLTETALEHKHDLEVSKTYESVHRRFKCCVNILQKNMEKHVKSKMHLKCASGAGRGFGGRREGAGRKPAVTFDRCVQKTGQQSMQADALCSLGIAASKVAITVLWIP